MSAKCNIRLKMLLMLRFKDSGSESFNNRVNKFSLSQSFQLNGYFHLDGQVLTIYHYLHIIIVLIQFLPANKKLISTDFR